MISFQPRDCHSSFLFTKQNLLKFEDKIQLENALYSYSINTYILPSIFDNCFTLCSDIHNYNTAASSTGKLFESSFRTNLHGKNSTISAVNAWNKTVFGDFILKNLTNLKVKTLLKHALINVDKY